MTRLQLLGAVAFLLLQVARCDNPLVSRDEPLGPGEVAPIADIEYKPEAGSMPLSGRDLISEWTNTGGLSKRYCVDAGYVPCSDSGCCPSVGQCCPGSPYCRTTNGVCCGSTGTCPSGYTCNSTCRCVETGGTCCSNGRYCVQGQKCCTSGCAPIGGECCKNGQICDTGNICVVNKRTGRYGCCTDLTCTAYVESGSTIALTPTAPKTTAAPRTSSVYDVEYRYYYWTMTWYYYSYYYTYLVVAQQSTLTKTYVTTTTIISAYESDSAAASSELSSRSSVRFRSGFPTPADATTALVSATGTDLPSASAPTPIVESGDSGDSGDDGDDGDDSGSGFGVGPGIGGVGGGGSVGGAGMVQSSLPTLTLWAFAMGAVAVGTGMLLL